MTPKLAPAEADNPRPRLVRSSTGDARRTGSTPGDPALDLDWPAPPGSADTAAAAGVLRAAAAEDWRGPAARPVGTRSAAGEAPAESRDERGVTGSATDDFRGGAVDVDCSAPSVVSAAATAQTCGLSNDNPAAAKAAAATRLVLTSPATTTN